MTTDETRATYLIATDDGSDADYSASREAGLDMAASDGAAVVLYDRSTESAMTDPYPVGPWSDEDDAVSAQSEMEPGKLESLGRGYLADQVQQARDRGIPATAYLGQGSGVEALRRAVERFGPQLVVLPESVRKSGILDKVKHNTWDDFASSIAVEIRLVDADGNVV